MNSGEMLPSQFPKYSAMPSFCKEPVYRNPRALTSYTIDKLASQTKRIIDEVHRKEALNLQRSINKTLKQNCDPMWPR